MILLILINLLVLAGVSVGIWFLTGYDKTMGGESLSDHHFGRLLRTSVVMFLIALGMILAEDHNSGYIGVLYIMAVPFAIALLLRSAISEILAHGFLRMADPMLSDHGTFDPKKSERYMETVGHLIRTGQREQAIKLCEEFKRTGEVDLTTLETTLEYLGVKQGPIRALDPLAEARRMRVAGRFAEAEASLRAALAKKPDNFEAGLLLIRIYLENLQQPARAQEILSRLETQSHITPALLEIARRTVQEGGQPPETAPADNASSGPKTVEEALAQGGLGTAVALLEEQIKQDPANFTARLQLMELQARRCNNFPRAEKILKEIEASGLFPAQQTDDARAQLKQWRQVPGN